MRVGPHHVRAGLRWLWPTAMFALQACGSTMPRSNADEALLSDSSVSSERATAPRDVSTPGTFTARALAEASAAVRSFSHAGVYWTLNDSGNDARIFAFDSAGRDLGTVRVSGARNRDWEAMATGPCEAGRCLYIGDVGDNLARHEAVVIWRIAEPAPPGAGTRVESEPAVAIAVQYPGGPRDVEAMWVDADTVVWLATKRPMSDAQKRWRPSLVYRVPAAAWRAANRSASDTIPAELVDSLPIVPRRERTLVTDAGMSNPFGDPSLDSLLAVRAYGEVLILQVGRNSGRPRSLLGRCDLDVLREKQGEGVTWLPDGRLLLTSEKRAAPLRALRCP